MDTTLGLLGRYAKEIVGVLGCFDRLVVTGTLREIAHPEAMDSFLHRAGFRAFDIGQFADPLTAEQALLGIGFLLLGADSCQQPVETLRRRFPSPRIPPDSTDCIEDKCIGHGQTNVCTGETRGRCACRALDGSGGTPEPAGRMPALPEAHRSRFDSSA